MPAQSLIGIKYSQFRLAIGGGFSYTLAKVPKGLEPTADDYLRSLKSGFHFRADANYFFNRQFGIGLKYSYFGSKGSVENIRFLDDQGNIIHLDISDEISNNFIGPTFLIRFLGPVNKNAFIVSISMGYMGYKNYAYYGFPFTLNGSTLAMAIDLGYDIGISENLSLGFWATLYFGSLSKLTYDDGFSTETIELSEEQRESVSRIDLSVILSFNK